MQTTSDLMTVNPLTVAPDTPLREVWDLMEREDVRQLPVMDRDKLVGIVTARDICSVARTPLFDAGFVEMVMSENPVTISVEAPAYRAAEILRAYKFGALPVVDNEQLVGILTVSDFLDSVSTMYKAAMPRVVWNTNPHR